MKLYGFKTSIFGMAFRTLCKDRQLNPYDAIKRACKKRARQEGRKQCKDGE